MITNVIRISLALDGEILTTVNEGAGLKMNVTAGLFLIEVRDFRARVVEGLHVEGLNIGRTCGFVA